MAPKATRRASGTTPASRCRPSLSGLTLAVCASSSSRRAGGTALAVALAAVLAVNALNAVSLVAAAVAVAAALVVARRPPRLSHAGIAVSVAVLVAVAAAIGWPLQAHYYEHRYASTLPESIEPSARRIRYERNLRIAAGGFRAHYALYDAGLTNRVEFPALRGEHGIVRPITTCQAWQESLADGAYDYVVTFNSEGDGPPPEAAWTASYPGVRRILRVGENELFRLPDRGKGAIRCSG